jgi:hypothetical protein
MEYPLWPGLHSNDWLELRSGYSLSVRTLQLPQGLPGLIFITWPVSLSCVSCVTLLPIGQSQYVFFIFKCQ